MKFHPLAEIFPLMSADEMESLRQDMRENGYRLHSPVILHEGQILDGRNRYMAAQAEGVEPTYGDYSGADPLGYVVALNLKRRHLTSSQKAFVALEIEKCLAELAKQRHRANGGDKKRKVDHKSASQKVDEPNYGQDKNENRAASQAAKVVGTNREYVAQAKKVQAEAPDVAEAVKNGDISLREAMRLVKRKETKEAPLPKGKYSVFYADPPWKYNDQMTESYGGAEYHYPTMSLDELCALPVSEMANENAVLFLWTTSPLLEDSFKVVRAWGFRYKTSFVWDKVKHNMGHYNSVRHEFLLVCVRGSYTPEVSKLFDSVVTEERTAHSAKPHIFREMIETLYPASSKVELFARNKQEGWVVWGNQI